MKLFLFLLFLLCAYFPSTVQASELECGSANQLNESLRYGQSVVVAVSQSDLLQGAWSCTKRFFSGVWDATGGTMSRAWDCLTSPIDCGNAAITGAKNAWNFLKSLTTNMGNMIDAFGDLPGQAKIDLLCEIIGGVGSSVAIAIMTAGAASAVAAKVIASLSLKMIQLGKILQMVRGINPKKLARLPDDVLEKASELATAGYGRVVRRAVKACPI